MSSETSLPDDFEQFRQPPLSHHAADRWDERFPHNSVAPETAFRRGRDVPDEARRLYRTGHHPTPHRVRVYAGDADGERYCAVFLVVEEAHTNIVATVYRAASIHDRARRAYTWALATEGSA